MFLSLIHDYYPIAAANCGFIRCAVASSQVAQFNIRTSKSRIQRPVCAFKKSFHCRFLAEIHVTKSGMPKVFQSRSWSSAIGSVNKLGIKFQTLRSCNRLLYLGMQSLPLVTVTRLHTFYHTVIPSFSNYNLVHFMQVTISIMLCVIQ